MQLNCKVIKKWQPPISASSPPFQGCPPFLAKCLVPPSKWLNFWKVQPQSPPPLIRGEERSNYAGRLNKVRTKLQSTWLIILPHYSNVIKSFKMTLNSKNRIKLKTWSPRYGNIKIQSTERRKPSLLKE